MAKRILIIFGFFTFMVACMTTSKELTAIEKNEYLTLGDSLSTYVQQKLLKNLTHAIEKYGTSGAVTFCSEQAIPITEQVGAEHNVVVHRLTDKNRNPDNILSSETDKKAWQAINQMMPDKELNPKHWVGKEGDAVFYYKAIPIGMPTCLKCHGNKDTDIDPETFETIAMTYPKDKATGYEMGQLRGVWKIKLK